MKPCLKSSPACGSLPPAPPFVAPATVSQSPASSGSGVLGHAECGDSGVAAEQARGGISETWRGPTGGGSEAGFAQEKAPLRPPAAPPWHPAPRPRTAPASQRARRIAAAREPKGSGGRAGQAARPAAAKATAEAAGRARAHCRGARFGGRGSVQSSLFDGISVYRVYTLISTCFLLLLLLLLRDLLLLLLLLFILRNFAPAVRSAAAQPGRDAGRRRAAGGGSPLRSPRLPAEPRARRAMARRPRHR